MNRIGFHIALRFFVRLWLEQAGAVGGETRVGNGDGGRELVRSRTKDCRLF